MKLLIADDEFQIRTGLAESIDWKSLGIDTVITAENGLDAFEKCQKNRPEIVVTDIRMPGIDGIQLTRQLTELYAPLKVIILSGYSEFSYAQESVKLGVADYLLKPVSVPVLESKVAQCRQELLQQASEQQLKKAYTKHQRQSELQQALKHPAVLNNENLKMLSGYTGMEVSETCFIAIVGIDDAPEQALPQIVSYLQAALPALEKARCVCLFSEPDGLTLLIPAFFADRMEAELRTWQAETNARLTAQFCTTVSVAISDTGTLRLAALQYEQAGLVMNHRTYCGAGSFLTWREFKMYPGFNEHFLLPYFQLEEAVSQQQVERTYRILKEYFGHFYKNRVTATDPLRAACHSLRSVLLSVLKEKGFTEDALKSRDEKLLDALPRYVTVQGYENWAKQMCEKAFSQLQLLEGHSCSKEVLQVANYILSHFSESLTLEDAVQLVGRSKNYFSSVFKKEMGMSFVDYINHVRINEARRLLETTDALTYEIADKVGFSDYKYFSLVFKKAVGVSPSHYRKKLG